MRGGGRYDARRSRNPPVSGGQTGAAREHTRRERFQKQ